MQDINELKNIIIQGFESKGILSQIRAQIRASVFKAIEDENNGLAIQSANDSFQWENKMAMKMRDDEELVILCKLFENFLHFYDLEYSLNVFSHEVNSHSIQNGEELRTLKSKKVGNQHQRTVQALPFSDAREVGGKCAAHFNTNSSER